MWNTVSYQQRIDWLRIGNLFSIYIVEFPHGLANDIENMRLIMINDDNIYNEQKEA